MPRKRLSDHISPIRIVGKTELGQFFGIESRAVDVWIQKGLPVIEVGMQGRAWKFDLLECCKWKFAPEEAKEDDEGIDPELLSPAERLSWYKGAQERDKYLAQQGVLLEKDAVFAAVKAAFGELKVGLLGQHSVIANKFPSLKRSVILGILAENRRLLERLSKKPLPPELKGMMDG